MSSPRTQTVYRTRKSSTQSTSSNTFRSILMLPAHLRIRITSDIIHWNFSITCFSCHSAPAQVYYTSRQFLPFNLITLTIWSERTNYNISPSLCNFYHPHFFLLESNILFGPFSSNINSLYSRMKYQVLPPYKNREHYYFTYFNISGSKIGTWKRKVKSYSK